MNKTKVELTETGIFVQVLNPMTGRMEWKSQPEDYDYQQELARAAFAGKSQKISQFLSCRACSEQLLETGFVLRPV